MFGSQSCHTSEDAHNCYVLLVIGANPWIAHGFPNARDHLNHIRKDPARKLIVVDPRRSETARMADLHLAVRRVLTRSCLARCWPHWSDRIRSTMTLSGSTRSALRR